MDQSEQFGAGSKEQSIVVNWIEKHFGGKVINIERQGRWRPAWFVDVAIGDKTHALYARGERTETFLAHSIEREYHVHKLVDQGGVKVPHVHGFIDELPGYVMDVVPGQQGFTEQTSPSDRAAVRSQFVAQMALMHSLDIEPFRQAGLRVPETPRDIALSHFDDSYAFYLSRRKRNDPAIDFVAKWVLENVQESTQPARCVASDAGQFLCDGAQLTALIDFELAVLGDPLIDLTALRVRGLWESHGDIPSLYREYEAYTGIPLDWQHLRYQTVAHAIVGPMIAQLGIDELLANPAPDVDYYTYAAWGCLPMKVALEAMAEFLGLALDPLPEPHPRPSPMDDALFAMGAATDSLADDTETAAYRKRKQQQLFAYIARQNAYGAQFEADYIGDVAALTGAIAQEARGADRILVNWVKDAGREHDEALLRLMHRQVCRQAHLMAVPGSPFLAGLTQPLAPIG